MHTLPELSFAELAGATEDAAGTLVLTVNNRHARRLLTDLSAYDPTHATRDVRRVREVPRIVPLSVWMRQMADDLSFTQSAYPAHVLDAFGAQQLWARIITKNERQRPLLDAQQTARLAMQADRLMVDWQLTVPEDAQSLETARFVHWRKAYLRLLARLDAHDDARLVQSLLHAAARDALPTPFDRVVLAGFAEASPAVQILLTCWQRQGLQVVRLQSATPQAGLVVRTVAQTHEAQWRAAAAWAACQLQRHPRGHFAIVAPQLEADMPFAHRVLREVLPDQPYNIAVARSLAEWPLVRAALAWLRVLMIRESGLAPALVGTALLAGACAGHRAEAGGRAAIDAHWRTRGVLRVTHGALMQQMVRHTPRLHQALMCAMAQESLEDPRGNTDTLDAWVARFRRDLCALGFPGETTQDSATYQTLQALDVALDQAVAQAFAFGTMGRAQALTLLERLLRQTRFQPMRDPATRLDVLGLLEADGGRWDAVWVLGLHDAVLPATPRPNPLLPLPVLRAAGTPRATLARELQWAQATHDALLRCAPRVLFSHAQQHQEEPLRVSPLLAHWPEIALDAALRDDWRVAREVPDARPYAATDRGAALTVAAHATLSNDPVQLEILLDAQGPPLSGKPLRGGIGVIDTQARHPLWAFVKYRLGASQMDDYAQLANANTRGNFLHHCMELIWRVLPDQAALQQCKAQDRLSALVKEAIAQAAAKHLQDYGPMLCRLECARATAVLHDWLAVECARAPFRIHALEQTVHWRDGPLDLRVRLDRVDILEAGGLAVMDYKTGAGSIAVRNDWMRDRPVNVQLPFYAAMLAHAPHPVVALVLVRLHARNVQLRGLARDSDVQAMKGVDHPAQWPLFETMTWDEVMQYWRRAMHAIAREVSEGVASHVVRRMSDLQYCDVLPFLRLHEVIEGTAGKAHG